MQNNKNLLQEHFQKQYLSLPKYETICIGMVDNQQQWQTKLTLFDGSKYIGEPAFSKKVAESSAAEQALLALSSKPKTLKSLQNTVKNNMAIMIDVENLHNFHKSIPEKDYDRFDVYIFVGKNHNTVDKVFHERATKIISPSTRPNGTDTCMQVFIGSCLERQLYRKYFIATGDRFGDNLVEMITCDTLGWKSQEAYAVVKYSQINDCLI